MDSESVPAVLRVLDGMRGLPLDDPERLRIERAALALVRDGQQRRKRSRRRASIESDAAVLAATAMGAADRVIDAPVTAGTGEAGERTGGPGEESADGTGEAAPAMPSRDGAQEPAGGGGRHAGGELRRARNCYICKDRFTRVGPLYHLLCPSCAAFNTARRTARTDLSGRRALVTGGRTKIGHHLALKMLRDGAHVTVTTRFPADAVRRFAQTGDWTGRLEVVGIDLRDPRQVVALGDRFLEAGEPLDILVNNAAQTLRRPPSAYAALAEGERAGLPPGASTVPGFVPASAGSPLPLPRDVAANPADPTDPVDVSGLLPDPSARNSWSARIGEIDPAEVLEVQLVNAVAPFLLIDRLLPLLVAAPSPRRYIVNVSAVEGRFAAANKTGRHPHTNMAKAGLNMLTRTSAADLARRGVYLCSVDTGWITDEVPLPMRDRLDRRTPLDVIDGAARVYDPIVRGEAGRPVYGIFLKDYAEASW